MLALAIEWKYGFVASTGQVDPSDEKENPVMEITAWRHKTISKPSKAQLATDIQEYQDYLADKEEKKVVLDTAKQVIKDRYKNMTLTDITDNDVLEYKRLEIAQKLEL